MISSYPRNFEIEDLETMKIKRHQEDDSNTHVMVIDEENVFKEGYFSMKKGLSIGDNEIKNSFQKTTARIEKLYYSKILA